MNTKHLFSIGGAAALGLALTALPASSTRTQKADDSKIACLQQRIEELEGKLQAQMERRQDQQAVLADVDTLEQPVSDVILENQDPTQIEVLPGIETDDLNIVVGDDGSSWLGVETMR